MIEQGFPAFGAAPWLPHSFTTTPLAQPARQRRHRNAQRRRPQRCASSSRRTLAPSYASIRVSDSTTQRDLRHAICDMRMHVGHRDRIRFAHHASRMSDRRMRSVSAMRCDAFVSSPRARSAHRMRERASEIRARCRIHASFFSICMALVACGCARRCRIRASIAHVCTMRQRVALQAAVNRHEHWLCGRCVSA